MSVANLGGAGRPPQGFDPLPTQRVSPLYYFEISIFVSIKFFQRRLWRQSIHILRGQRARRKNAILRSKFSKKCLKTPFFKNLLAEQKICYITVFIIILETSENLVDLKKVDKIFNFFKIPPRLLCVEVDIGK